MHYCIGIANFSPCVVYNKQCLRCGVVKNYLWALDYQALMNNMRVYYNGCLVNAYLKIPL